jgi:hypothetical protein
MDAAKDPVEFRQRGVQGLIARSAAEQVSHPYHHQIQDRHDAGVLTAGAGGA